jgi:thioredoxin-related protein
MRLLRFAVLLLLAALTLPSSLVGSLASSPADAAELVMYRRAGCPWCAAWDREIGPVYGKTEIGRRLPVRLVALEGERPHISLASPIVYSPTFVMVDHEREIGRIEGYPGPDFFWGLLDQLVQKLPAQTPNSAVAPDQTNAASPSQ